VTNSVSNDYLLECKSVPKLNVPAVGWIIIKEG
jgi:hypothetical protein